MNSLLSYIDKGCGDYYWQPVGDGMMYVHKCGTPAVIGKDTTALKCPECEGKDE